MGFMVAVSLGTIGSVLLKLNVPRMSWQVAISSAIILLLGGYGDLFGGLELTTPIPWWVQFICFLITVISLLFILGAIGLLADRLLSSRLEFLRRRPPVPKAEHVVLVGLGRVGQQIGTCLYEFRQPFVCLTHVKEQQDFMPQVALVCSPILRGLSKVNLAHDRLVVLATINGLRRIEWGILAPPRRWQLQALRPLDPGATYYAGNILENVAGCHLSEARAFMENLPSVLNVPNVMELSLYDHQAFHLVRKLRKLLPVHLIPIGEHLIEPSRPL